MIPTNCNNISTRQFMRFDKVKKKVAETDRERMDLVIEKACILTGLEESQAEQLKVGELNNLKQLQEAGIPEKIYKTFKLNGVWYEFILDPNELNAERWAGIMEAIKQDPIQGISQTLYYLAKPFRLQLLRRKYFNHTESEVPKVIQSFGDIPITVSYPIAVFFLTLSKECTNYLEDYSLSELKRMNQQVTQAEQDLQSHTDGLKQLKM